MGNRSVGVLGRFSRMHMIVVAVIVAAVVLAALVITPSLVQAKSSTDTTFTVNSTLQDSDSDTTDNVCDTDRKTKGEQCTLRAAYEQADRYTGHNTINFNIPTTDPGYDPATGVFTINFVRSESASIGYHFNNPVTIDGYSQPGAEENTLAVGNDAVLKIELVYSLDQPGDDFSNKAANTAPITIHGDGSVVRGLAIRGFNTQHLSDGWYEGNGAGIHVAYADNAVVEGNFLGTDASGAAAREINDNGVLVQRATNTTIGGTTPAARNLISGNLTGTFLVVSTGTKVQGNYIGPDKSGTAALPNSHSQRDVRMVNASNNIIGGTTREAGNLIAFSSGVLIYEEKDTKPFCCARSHGNSILSNSIHSNSSLGIDLAGGRTAVNPNDEGDGDDGANRRQNFPVIASAKTFGGETVIKGTLNSTPNTSFIVQFFKNPKKDPSGYGEGKTFLGQKIVTTGGRGNASFAFRPTQKVETGKFITATATNQATGDTSEFSRAVKVVH